MSGLTKYKPTRLSRGRRLAFVRAVWQSDGSRSMIARGGRTHAVAKAWSRVGAVRKNEYGYTLCGISLPLRYQAHGYTAGVLSGLGYGWEKDYMPFVEDICVHCFRQFTPSMQAAWRKRAA